MEDISREVVQENFKFDEVCVVYVRQYPSSPEMKINIEKDQGNVQELLTTEPEVITPPGLSAERSWYLRECPPTL